MIHIKFEINHTPCELTRNESGYLLTVCGEPKIRLTSFEVWLWLNGKLDISEDALILESTVDSSTTLTVMEFVGIDYSRFI